MNSCYEFINTCEFHNLGFVDVILVTRVQRSKKAVEEVVKIIPLTVQLVDIKAVAALTSSSETGEFINWKAFLVWIKQALLF